MTSMKRLGENDGKTGRYSYETFARVVIFCCSAVLKV